MRLLPIALSVISALSVVGIGLVVSGLVTTFTSATGDLDLPSSRYYLSGEMQEYLLDCFAPGARAARWLSIAETFKPLPVEE